MSRGFGSGMFHTDIFRRRAVRSPESALLTPKISALPPQAPQRCSPSRPVFDMFCSDMSQSVASPRETCALLADYRPVSGAFDELFTATGELRAHFVPLVRDLDRLGTSGTK